MLQHIPTALYSLYIYIYIYIHIHIYIYNVAPEDGVESPKHVEHPEIKSSYNNLYILLVHFHIAV